MHSRATGLRRTVAAATVVTLLALLATPAAAQSANRALIDQLNSQLLYVALPLSLFVEVILVYAIVRFRDNDDPKPTTEDPALEITWTAATGVILLFVGVSAYIVFTSPYITPAQPVAASDAPGNATPTAEVPEDAVAVDVLAYQWGWEFRYENGATSQRTLVLPADREVYLTLTADDVLHSIFVPALGIKQDVFPGSYRRVRTNVTETGRYRLFCSEFCGDGHARMQATVVVVDESAYDEWVEARADNESTAAPTPGNASVAAPA